MSTSALVTYELVQRAMMLVRPAILDLLSSGHVSRTCMHIVLLDPSNRADLGHDWLDAILYEESFGTDDPDWGQKFINIARAKAQVSWRTGLPSHVVALTMPALYHPGDTKYGGSMVLDGITASASGVQWQLDLFVSTIITAAIRSLALMKMAEITASDQNFLPDPENTR